jgi:hypothetical protein
MKTGVSCYISIKRIRLRDPSRGDGRGSADRVPRGLLWSSQSFAPRRSIGLGTSTHERSIGGERHDQAPAIIETFKPPIGRTSGTCVDVDHVGPSKIDRRAIALDHRYLWPLAEII